MHAVFELKRWEHAHHACGPQASVPALHAGLFWVFAGRICRQRIFHGLYWPIPARMLLVK
jgi:hypothetical protein